MNDKYTFTDGYIVTPSGAVLHRIKSLKDFGDVKTGMLGGFIEKEENLSIDGNAWVYNNAQVYGNARVRDNAFVDDNAKVFGNALVNGNAQVHDNARVFNDAFVYDNACISNYVQIYNHARIHGNARICDTAQVCDTASVYGNAYVSDDVHIYNNAQVYDDAQVFGRACICGDAKIYGNAIIGEENRIQTGSCDSDIRNNLIENIRVQTNLLPMNGEVIAYKQVRKDLSSYYDPNFIYKIGEWAEVSDYDPSSHSCSKGLHFSNPNYWNNAENARDSTFLIAKIKLEDIITVQAGKIRCKRAFILGTYNIE